MDDTDILRQFSDAQDAFGALVMSVRDRDWAAPTPCSEWDVRALVNHLVGEQLWATPMLQGLTIDAVGTRLDGDLLNDNPHEAWVSSAEASRAAFSASGALDGSINSSAGPSPSRQYLAEMTFDLLVHRWDLGSALGRLPRFSDDELQQLSFVVDSFAPMSDELVAAGMFATPVQVSSESDAQTRLLAALGRTA